MKTKSETQLALTWEIDLAPIVGKIATLETRDGVHREGRITAVSLVEFTFNGREVEIPFGFELNGDPGDLVEFARLVRLDLR